MSACQPCPPCAGKVGSDRKKSEVSWQGGSRPESFRILCPGHGSTGDRRALLVPCRCHRSAASPELCPVRECCQICLLQPLSPRVLESPPWFPRLPLCPMGELPCPYLSVVAFNNFFFPTRAHPALPSHCTRGSSPSNTISIKRLLFCLQNSPQKHFISTSSDFPIHLEPPRIPCFVTFLFCGQAGPCPANRRTWSTFFGQPGSCLCCQTMDWDWLDFSSVM